ncbi:hypothetical protein [Thalassoglobus neptunius]|nr:hypothetical protein [Thalassoglobus neptunius]
MSDSVAVLFLEGMRSQDGISQWPGEPIDGLEHRSILTGDVVEQEGNLFQ